MTPSRPYLIRAIHEWVLDNGMTPYLLVDVQVEDVDVPMDSVQDGKIVLNISPQAVQSLAMNNDFIAFNARFSGESTYVSVPAKAVLAIYARENGRGMVFTEEDAEPPEGPDGPDDDSPKRPTLTVVK